MQSNLKPTKLTQLGLVGKLSSRTSGDLVTEQKGLTCLRDKTPGCGRCPTGAEVEPWHFLGPGLRSVTRSEMCTGVEGGSSEQQGSPQVARR